MEGERIYVCPERNDNAALVAALAGRRDNNDALVAALAGKRDNNDALVTALAGKNDAMMAAIMNRRDDNPMAEAAMMNGGMGNNMWNNPFMYLVWMWMMRWMNGNGEFGNGQGLANQLNNDANTNLIMRGIDGNTDAIRTLSTTLNCDFNSLRDTLCSIKGGIDQVSGQIGYSAERVINAVQMGDCNVISKMQECCCTTQRSIDAVNLNLTRMGYEDQLAVCQQTNALISNENNNTQRIIEKMSAEGIATRQSIADFKQAWEQARFDSLLADKNRLQTVLDLKDMQQSNAAMINAAITPVAAGVAANARQVESIACKMPPTMSIPYTPAMGSFIPVNYGINVNPYASTLNGCGC